MSLIIKKGTTMIEPTEIRVVKNGVTTNLTEYYAEKNGVRTLVWSSVAKYTLHIVNFGLANGIVTRTASPQGHLPIGEQIPDGGVICEGDVITVSGTGELPNYVINDFDINGGYYRKLNSTYTITGDTTVNCYGFYNPGYLVFENSLSEYIEIGTLYNTKSWNGTMEFSLDNGASWNIWSGETIRSNNYQSICLRGTNNTYITTTSDDKVNSFTVTSSNNYLVNISGNFETLLNYQDTLDGKHPTLGEKCFVSLFKDCKSIDLINAYLGSLSLSNRCCDGMFNNCVWTQYPIIMRANFFADFSCQYMYSGCIRIIRSDSARITFCGAYCFRRMYANCTALKESLPIENFSNMINSSSFENMFRDCTNLETLLSINAERFYDLCLYGMYRGCSKIKISTTYSSEYKNSYRIPMSGSYSKTGDDQTTTMFNETGGTFKGTPELGTTYYTSNDIV